jgi:hypothetical protein
MKVTIPIGLLLLVALVAYALGTESGRAQKELILVKLGRKDAEGDEAGGDAPLA